MEGTINSVSKEAFPALLLSALSFMFLLHMVFVPRISFLGFFNMGCGGGALIFHVLLFNFATTFFSSSKLYVKVCLHNDKSPFLRG